MTNKLQKQKKSPMAGNQNVGFTLKHDKFNSIVLLSSIFLIAFSVRFINLEIIKNNPYFNHPTMDEKYHDEWAQEIADGRLLDKAPFYRAPLYPFVLGVIYTIFGKGYFLARLLGIVFGSISCVFIYLIGKELYSHRVGLLSALFASFYSIFLYYDSMLLTVYLEIFFFLLTIIWLIKWIKKLDVITIFLTGLFCGFASITRPNFIILIPAIVLYIIIAYPRIHIKQRFKYIFFLSLGTLLIIFPIILINIIKGRDVVLIAWNGGINFFLGNNHAANGWSATAPGLESTWWGGYNDAIVIAEKAAGNHHLLASQVSNYWYKQGINFILGKPLEWLSLMWKKIYFLINVHELSNNQSIQGFQEYSWLLRIPIINYGMVLAFSIWGIIKSLKIKKTIPILIMLFVYAFSIVIFFVCARYRIVLVPLLIIFASYTIIMLYDMLKEKKYKYTSGVILLTAGLLIFINTDFYGTHRVDRGEIHASIGNRYVESANYPKAIEEYVKALKYNTKNTDVINAIGNSYFLMHEYYKAEFVYQQSVQIEKTVDALCKLGLLKMRRNDMDSAKIYFDEALALKPNNPEPYYYIGLYYKLIKQPTIAAEKLETALQYNPDPQYKYSIYYALGKIYQEIGNNDKSVLYLKKAEEYKNIKNIILE